MNPRYTPLQIRDCALLHAYLVSHETGCMALPGYEPANPENPENPAEQENLSVPDDNSRAVPRHNLPPNMLSHVWLPLSRLISNVRGQQLLRSPGRPRRPKVTILCAGANLESRLFALFAE